MFHGYLEKSVLRAIRCTLLARLLSSSLSFFVNFFYLSWAKKSEIGSPTSNAFLFISFSSSYRFHVMNFNVT